VAMPLWMTGNLPGFDERLELSLITILAGTAISREVAPMFKAMKQESLDVKNKCVAGRAARLSRCGERVNPHATLFFFSLSLSHPSGRSTLRRRA
jgi:hypothetical protein